MSLKIEYVAAADLQAADYNPRRMTEHQAETLRESFRRFGFVDPLVVNSNPARKNVLIGGHQRLRIALEPEFAAKYASLPVVYVDLDQDRERELNLRLNKNLGEWDWDLLAGFDMDELLEVGFEREELERQFGLDVNPAAEDEQGDLDSLKKDVTCPKCGHVFAP